MASSLFRPRCSACLQGVQRGFLCLGGRVLAAPPDQREELDNLREHREFLEKISPIRLVDRIRCPLMVIHGANDPRVPVEEAEQIVAALRKRKVPVD
jgi:dipeptidyl aminopeptidase/acylaminoacyl peptidase